LFLLISQAHPAAPRRERVNSRAIFQYCHEDASPPSDEPHDGTFDFYRHGEAPATSNLLAISNIEIAKNFGSPLVIAARRLRTDKFDFWPLRSLYFHE
jgi:hypothetical protein